MVSNLLSCLSVWTGHFNKNVDVIYLDFEKAFDKVPISRLLQKFAFIEIRGKLLGWIEAFLGQTTFQVGVGDVMSDHRETHSGVGSVLGPVLYIVYTFDLPAAYSVMSVYLTPFIDHDRLQDDLNKVLGSLRNGL